VGLEHPFLQAAPTSRRQTQVCVTWPHRNRDSLSPFIAVKGLNHSPADVPRVAFVDLFVPGKNP
jgi:hypothetical protein